MTCIVGIIEKDIIYIGADSAGADSSFYRELRKDKKVFIREPFIFGFTTSFRMGQLLMFDSRFGVRKQKNNEDDYMFMIDAFIPAVIHLFKEGGFLNNKDNE